MITSRVVIGVICALSLQCGVASAAWAVASGGVGTGEEATPTPTAPTPEIALPNPSEAGDSDTGGATLPAPGIAPTTTAKAKIVSRGVNRGLARPPAGAPTAVKLIIQAGNKIARHPYLWGGGHGRWKDRGYDCSGSVSYALHGAGLLDTSLTSGEFMSWGEAGPGQWVTVYAHGGHVYMMVAGLRFDTSGRATAGSRWQTAPRTTTGYAVRRPAGL